MAITKVRQFGKLTLIVLIRKKIPEFVGEILAMIDKDHSKSTRSIARDRKVFEFLIRRVVRKDILYFSYKMRKGQFLSQATKNKRKDFVAKL